MKEFVPEYISRHSRYEVLDKPQNTLEEENQSSVISSNEENSLEALPCKQHTLGK